MYRIDNSTAAGALPAPTGDGPNPGGFFTEGDASSGVPATVVDDEWANMIQEELAHVVEDADGGNTPLSKATRTQVKTAIAAMIAAAVAAIENTWQTGDVKPALRAVAPAGWLLLNGETIGSAASAADQNDDALEDLFTALWTDLSDTHAPVSGGRGASAAADWAANKTLTLPDGRGRSLIGAGTGAGLTARTLGDDSIGEEDHTLTTAELAAHTHGVSAGPTDGSSSGGGGAFAGPGLLATSTSTGSDDPHNIMQPSLAANWMIKI